MVQLHRHFLFNGTLRGQAPANRLQLGYSGRRAEEAKNMMIIRLGPFVIIFEMRELSGFVCFLDVPQVCSESKTMCDTSINTQRIKACSLTSL